MKILRSDPPADLKANAEREVINVPAVSLIARKPPYPDSPWTKKAQYDAFTKPQWKQQLEDIVDGAAPCKRGRTLDSTEARDRGSSSTVRLTEGPGVERREEAERAYVVAPMSEASTSFIPS